MGIADTVVARLRCPECGAGEAEREVQFKHEGAFMEHYAVGDFVLGAPAGQPLLRGSFTCNGKDAPPGPWREGSHHAPCWIHLDRGFLTAVTLDAPERPEPAAWWMFERAGHDAREFRRALRGVRNIVGHRRASLAEPAPEAGDSRRFWLHRIETEADLLDQLEAAAKDAEARAWPGRTTP